MGLEVPINLRPGQVSETIAKEFVQPGFSICPAFTKGAIFTSVFIDEFEVLVSSPPIVAVKICVIVYGAGLKGGVGCDYLLIHCPSDLYLLRSVFALRLICGDAFCASPSCAIMFRPIINNNP